MVGTVITVVISAMCGYALAIYRKEIPYVNKVFAVFLLGTLIPGEILTIAQFTVVSEMGLYNNIWGCILPVVTTTTGIFMYRQHYMSIPWSLQSLQDWTALPSFGFSAPSCFPGIFSYHYIDDLLLYVALE